MFNAPNEYPHTSNCKMYNSKAPVKNVEILRAKQACWYAEAVLRWDTDLQIINTERSLIRKVVINTIMLQFMKPTQISVLTKSGFGLNLLWNVGATISFITFVKTREIGLISKARKKLERKGKLYLHM